MFCPALQVSKFSIKDTELSKNWLENYRHNLAKNMFFDIPTKTLR